jgi:hypothetical protein
MALEQLSDVSENSIIGVARPVLFALLFPGILGSMAMSGNVHAFRLWIAAGINGLIYFGLMWLAWHSIARLVKRKT